MLTIALSLILAGPLADDQPEVAPPPKPAQQMARDHFRLAQWCQQRGHTEKMVEQATKVLELEADHAGARGLLGFVRVGERWARKNPSQEWIQSLQRQVDADLQRLTSTQAEQRDQARAALLLTARIEDIPQLARITEQLHGQASRFHEMRRNTVLEVRAQNSRLLSNRTFRTSLGNGSPVNLQLPELRSIGIGTTVVVPSGG